MSPRETRIAVPVLLAVAAGFALLLYGMHLQGAAERIGALRTFQAGGVQYVAVFHGDRLHLLDASGRPLAQQTASALGLGEAPNDMDITVDAGGAVQAWFFDDTGPRIVRCALQGVPLRFADCSPVLAGASLLAQASSRAVHLAADPARGRLFLADAKSHTVRELASGGAGRELARSAQGLLWFPNRLRLSADGGSLIVADNDHHRLLWLQTDGPAPRLQQMRSVSVAAHPGARPGSRRAADFAALYGAGGELRALWVLALRQGQKNGDVLLWGADGQPGPRADLGGHGDPLVIDTLGDAALVGDFDGIALYRVDAAGRYLGPFGQGEFAAQLAASRDALARGALFAKAGWAVFALSLVAGFALAWRFGERPGQREAELAFAALNGAVAEVPRGTVVLEPQRWYVAQMRTLAWTLGLIPLVGVAFILARARHAFEPAWLERPAAWLAAGVMVATLAACVLGGAWFLRFARRRLVLSRGHAQVWSGDRMLAEAPVREVLASPRALLVAAQVLPYQGPQLPGRPARWIFDQQPLVAYLLAHVPAERRITQSAFGMAQLRRMPGWQRLAVAAPLLGWIALEAWRLLR